jgi:5-methylcytosine-specific restriction enzyme subunit McrC
LRRPVITVFEHEKLTLDGSYGKKIGPENLEILRAYYGEKGTGHFSLIHNGVKFCEYVGVLKIGKLTIEVLPKIDRGSEDKWKKILIDMLRKVGTLNILPTSETNLKIKENSILDLYFESFIRGIEQLTHQGLVKRYRKEQGNATSLKGKLLFQKHLSTNHTHHEKFFVEYPIYDKNHLLNQLLYKALKLVERINTNTFLESKLKILLLNFPELEDIKVSEGLFDKITYNRKTEPYRGSIQIAKMILLNYHPDINFGREKTIALMFDMNQLWERFVYVALKKHLTNGTVTQQASKPYVQIGSNRAVTLKPDVVIQTATNKYVLDTKWKLPMKNKPRIQDLQQMYAYTKYFNSDHTILCYPGTDDDFISGMFFNEQGAIGQHYDCSVLRLKFDESQYEKNTFIQDWQRDIVKRITNKCV